MSLSLISQLYLESNSEDEKNDNSGGSDSEPCLDLHDENEEEKVPSVVNDKITETGQIDNDNDNLSISDDNLQEILRPETEKGNRRSRRKRQRRSGNWMWTSCKSRKTQFENRKKNKTVLNSETENEMEINFKDNNYNDNCDEEEEENQSGNLNFPQLPVQSSELIDIDARRDKNVIKIVVEVLKCPYCFQTYSEANELIRHVEAHVYQKMDKGNNQLVSSTTKVKSATDFYKTKVISNNEIESIQENSDQARNEPDIFYKCSSCGYKFTDKWKLVNHMKLHTEKGRPWKCTKCSCRFQTSSTLKIHETKIHKMKQGRNNCTVSVKICGKSVMRNLCKICGKRFSHPSDLSRHILTHQERKIKCFKCENKFRRVHHLQSHLKYIHKTTMSFLKLKCILEDNFNKNDDASEKFYSEIPNELSLLSEIRKKSGKILLSRCDDDNDNDNGNESFAKIPSLGNKNDYSEESKSEKITDQTIINNEDEEKAKPNVSRHQTRSLTNKSVQCKNLQKTENKSGQSIISENNGKPQVPETAGPKSCKCLVCGIIIRSAEKNLKNHMELHNPVGRPFRCSVCSCNFKRPASLKQHMNQFHKDKINLMEKNVKITHSAIEIKKSSKIAKTLSKIKTGNVKQKQIKCSICNGFIMKKWFKKHMRIHDERNAPWKCSKCKSFFMTKSHLRRHENRTHVNNVKIVRNLKSSKSHVIIQKRVSPSKSNPDKPGLQTSSENSMENSPKSKSSKRFLAKNANLKTSKKMRNPISVNSNEQIPSDFKKCEKCGLSVNQRSFHRHMKLHEEKGRPWKCSICSCNFRRKKDVRFHEIKTHKGQRSTKNEEDETSPPREVTSSKELLTETDELVSNDSDDEINLENGAKRDEEINGSNSSNQSNKYIYRCPYCLESFLEANLLISHISSHTKKDG